MKKFTICAIALLLAACTDNNNITPDNPPNLKPLSDGERALSSANNDFAFNIFREVQSREAHSNIFISPMSVTMALAMTMNGASESTRESILEVLDFGDSTPEEVNEACKNLTSILTTMDRTVQLGLANSVWSNQKYTVRESFAAVIKNYYDGKVQALNFSNPNSVKTINSWVESKTNNRIKNLLNVLTDDMVMVLINAIYFNGDWTYKFDASKTYSAPFYKEDGTSQNVSTMFSKGTKVSLYQNENVSLIDIPYGNRQFSMTVLMPPPGHSVNELTETLNADLLNYWLEASDTLTPQLELPKFKMDWKKDLLGDLVNMGMQTSGFPYLFEENLPLAISAVIHQSYIGVDEKGTEAAAATAVVVELTSVAPSQPQLIKINRPFVYLIREKHTNAILFMGQMLLPSAQ